MNSQKIQEILNDTFEESTLHLLHESAGQVYIDFSLNIPGVFRTTIPLYKKGEEREEELVKRCKEYFIHVKNNLGFFDSFTLDSKATLSRSYSKENWGNGWEWKELHHPELKKDYRLDCANSFHTTSGGEKSSNPCPRMSSLYQIKNNGIALKYSYNMNRMPITVAYFFPDDVEFPKSA